MPTLRTSSRLFCLVAFATLLALPACSVNVAKDGDNKDKKVDIDTPLGGIHVSKGADVRDTGLAVYPGARPTKEEDEGDEKSANVRISSGAFGLKVVALEYESDDKPEKLIAYYKDQLKKFGPVLECRSSGHGHGGNVNYSHDSDGSKPVSCDGDDHGKNIELKVGTQANQHIVAIEPQENGVKFGLVYVQVHGKDTI